MATGKLCTERPISNASFAAINANGVRLMAMGQRVQIVLALGVLLRVDCSRTHPAYYCHCHYQLFFLFVTNANVPTMALMAPAMLNCKYSRIH